MDDTTIATGGTVTSGTLVEKKPTIIAEIEADAKALLAKIEALPAEIKGEFIKFETAIKAHF